MTDSQNDVARDSVLGSEGTIYLCVSSGLCFVFTMHDGCGSRLIPAAVGGSGVLTHRMALN